jgi:hypothetical protein
LGKDFDGLYDHELLDDGKRVLRITIGSSIYEVRPDEVKSIYIKVAKYK